MSSVRKSSRLALPAPSPEVAQNLCRFLTQSTGITADPQRLARMLLKLEKRMADLDVSSWEDYYHFLSVNQEEFLTFAALMTVNKTNFFREEKHFGILRDHALATWEKKPQQKFLCWSAACSTGEEVYSMAMTLHELKAQNHLKYLDYGILGTDINRDVLSQGESGVYSEDVVLREVPPHLLKRYFWRGKGSQDGLYKVDEELRSHTKFRLFNLVKADDSPQVKFDIIFLRNVLIYFNPLIQKQVIVTVARHLSPSGLLCLGLCERMPDSVQGFQALGASVYRYEGGA